MSGIVASTLPWRGHFSGPGAQHTIAALRLHAERWGRGSGVTHELVAASWVDVAWRRTMHAKQSWRRPHRYGGVSMGLESLRTLSVKFLLRVTQLQDGMGHECLCGSWGWGGWVGVVAGGAGGGKGGRGAPAPYREVKIHVGLSQWCRLSLPAARLLCSLVTRTCWGLYSALELDWAQCWSRLCRGELLGKARIRAQSRTLGLRLGGVVAASSVDALDPRFFFHRGRDARK